MLLLPYASSIGLNPGYFGGHMIGVQNDPFAKFMRDMAQNKGNYNPDEYSKLSKDQQITALKMSNQAAQAANPNPNETNQDQRNATLLQRYQDMQDKTGKSDAEINKMLKPDERDTFKKDLPW